MHRPHRTRWLRWEDELKTFASNMRWKSWQDTRLPNGCLFNVIVPAGTITLTDLCRMPSNEVRALWAHLGMLIPAVTDYA